MELVALRVYSLALGYEDLNDHDRLRCDPCWLLLWARATSPGMTGFVRGTRAMPLPARVH
jgi:hypothetical protein